MNSLLIVPIGELAFGDDDFEKIKHGIAAVFNSDIKLSSSIPLPDVAYDRLRCQWLANKVIQHLPETGEMILGIIDHDLYSPNLNFVFGEAHPQRDKAVISVTRLRPEFWHQKEDNDLLVERVVKEAVHEIGHLLGLGHCQDDSCIMHFSNTISDTDRKGPGFCKRCLQQLAR